MTGAIVLITNFLYGTVLTVVAGVLAAAMFIGLWYVLPVWERSRLSD